MDDNRPTLADAVAKYDPAEDVTDLDTARRLITALREQAIRAAEESMQGDGEYTIFLDEEHTRMLEHLYEFGMLSLGYDEDDPYWLDPPDLEPEALSHFVEECLDIAWDMAHDESEDKSLFPRRGKTAAIRATAA